VAERVISATRDDSGTGAVSIYGRETAAAGERRKTELWHIPRELTPNKPLCGANLSGQLKSTKGYANCSSCRSNATLQNFDKRRYEPVLRALYIGQPVPPYEDKWASHDGMLDADLVAEKNGGLVLTSRGKIIARDIIEPVGWYETRTRLFHKRRAISLETICGITCGQWNLCVSQIAELHDLARKHGRRTITCVRCAIYTEPRRDDVD
jgi:hypothetical protein